jgi:hypothetical protein
LAFVKHGALHLQEEHDIRFEQGPSFFSPSFIGQKTYFIVTG